MSWDIELGIVTALVLFMAMLVLFFVHFVPAMLAFKREHPQRWWITTVNIVFGWTFVGWIIALIWALTGSRK